MSAHPIQLSSYKQLVNDLVNLNNSNYMDQVVYNVNNQEVIRGVYSILIDNESKNGSMPKDHKWQYTWGKAKTGRTTQDYISINTPSYPKNEYIADISYRTIDSMGIMSIARHLKLENQNELFEYLLKGVKEGALWPFVAEELDLYDKAKTDAAILQSKAIESFLMPSGGYELQSASIALRKKLMTLKN